MTSKINWSELFPTKWSAVIFVLYMVLFINQGIFVTASQSSTNTYDYNTVTVVLLTEVLKLIISVVLYCKDNTVASLFIESKKSLRVMVLYFVPAAMYCFYNNLTFVNLSAFDPTTYFLLLQFRVVVTGIAFQVIFHKQLSGKQWVSLVLLTLGCMIKQVDMNIDTSTTKKTYVNGTVHISFHIFLIFVQTICSCFAGVFNEYLLKGEGAKVNIFIQNVFMYIDSVICNLVILVFSDDLSALFSSDVMSSIFTFKVMIIMLNNAFIGIITSFFLKNLNSILKTFASALELMFTAVICWILFGIPIYVNTVIAISIVSYAVYLYSQNPVVNKPKEQEEPKEDSDPLLENETV